MSNKAAFLLLIVAIGGLVAGSTRAWNRSVNVTLNNGLTGSYDTYTGTFTLYNDDARRWQSSSNLVVTQEELQEKAAAVRKEGASLGFGTAIVCGTISIGAMIRNAVIEKKKKAAQEPHPSERQGRG